jgi:succinate dehydrogenase / fumarate reductase, cytochrome b subunit
MSASYLATNLGKKQMMAITGLLWCGFVVGHMLGNLTFLLGPEAFNSYGNAITSSHLYYLIEAGLLATLLSHIACALMVVLENRAARPVGYAVSQQKGKKTSASFASRTMALSGLLVVVFVINHLLTFRFGPHYDAEYHGFAMRDLHKLMLEVFGQAPYVAWYVFAMAVLAFHLDHALWSALQTLGLIPDGKIGKIRLASHAFGFLVAVGFMVNPIYVLLSNGGAQ